MSNPLVLLTPAESAACCAPLAAQPLTMDQAEQVPPLLKALAAVGALIGCRPAR